jgi:hypothetical protein
LIDSYGSSGYVPAPIEEEEEGPSEFGSEKKPSSDEEEDSVKDGLE